MVPSNSTCPHTLLIICTVTLYYIYNCKLLAIWKENTMYNTSDKRDLEWLLSLVCSRRTCVVSREVLGESSQR